MKNSETISETDIKQDFPIFQHSPELVYLDNAATTHKPRVVIDAINTFYSKENANIQRGIYDLAHHATTKFEKTRALVAEFLNASTKNSICFTSGTTHSINLVAFGFVKKFLSSDKNIVISILEHHSNFLPWQKVCQQTGAELRIVGIDANGDLDLMDLSEKIDKKTTLVALTHISNSLGTINPIGDIIEMAHKKDTPVLIDAAQSMITHTPDLSELPIDFLAFSGHKIFGPQGVGILYVNEKYHQEMDPLIYGGGTVNEVSVEKTDFKMFPHKMEAGTQNIAGVIGLGEAISYLKRLDKGTLNLKISRLTSEIVDFIHRLNKFSVVGTPANRSHIVSFIHEHLHPHDIATILNEDKIAIRAGFHCTQPLLHELKTPATARVSLSVYNGENDVEKLKNSLKSIEKLI